MATWWIIDPFIIERTSPLVERNHIYEIPFSGHAGEAPEKSNHFSSGECAEKTFFPPGRLRLAASLQTNGPWTPTSWRWIRNLPNSRTLQPWLGAKQVQMKFISGAWRQLGLQPFYLESILFDMMSAQVEAIGENSFSSNWRQQPPGKCCKQILS